MEEEDQPSHNVQKHTHLKAGSEGRNSYIDITASPFTLMDQGSVSVTGIPALFSEPGLWFGSAIRAGYFGSHMALLVQFLQGRFALRESKCISLWRLIQCLLFSLLWVCPLL